MFSCQFEFTHHPALAAQCRCHWTLKNEHQLPSSGSRHVTPQVAVHLQVYQIKPLRAWGAVVTTLASMAGCLWLIAQAPWYMLPFAWALAGTAFTGVSADTG